MPKYAVDSERTWMTATGISEPVHEWQEMPDGRRRRSGTPARDDDTGLPLWALEVIYEQSAWVRASTATCKVTVPAEDEPTLDRFAPVTFAGPRVDVRVNRSSGAPTETWRADELASTGTGVPGPRTSKAAGLAVGGPSPADSTPAVAPSSGVPAGTLAGTGTAGAGASRTAAD